MKLLIATRNDGKKAEYASLLHGLGINLVSLADTCIDDIVEETGTTYADNALLKARTYAAIAGLATLADDSGLEVDALDGAPGVYSARYGGEGLDDEARYRLLLQEIEGVPEKARSARFRCVIALVWPDGREDVVEGVCEGRIAEEPRGENGFGYDPVFYVPKEGCYMAELPQEVKNRISHRAHAAEAVRDILQHRLIGI